MASILTRSILGGLLAGFGMAVLEPMSLVILVIVGRVLNRMEIANLYKFAATYHLDNARSWFVSGQSLPPPLPGFTAEPELVVSLIALVLWVVGLLGIAIVLFNRTRHHILSCLASQCGNLPIPSESNLPVLSTGIGLNVV